MWIVAITTGGTELLTSERLRDQGLEIFCPYTVVKSRIVVSRKPRVVFKAVETKIPHWPRYLFVRLQTMVDLVTVTETKGVHTIVRGAEQLPSTLPDSEMAKLRVGCKSDGLLTKRSPLLGGIVTDWLSFVEPEQRSLGDTLLFGKYAVRADELQGHTR